MLLISEKLKQKIKELATDEKMMEKSNAAAKLLREDYSQIMTYVGIDIDTTVITADHIKKILEYFKPQTGGARWSRKSKKRRSRKSKNGGKSKRIRRTRRRNKIGGADGSPLHVAAGMYVVVMPLFFIAFCALVFSSDEEEED